MSPEEHLEEAKEWRRSAILNRNHQHRDQFNFLDPDTSYLDSAHRCELRAEYHEQFVIPDSNLLRGYYNRD